jgi:hypothetical protein
VGGPCDEEARKWNATKRDGRKGDGRLKLRWIEDAESNRQMTGRRPRPTEERANNIPC